jgi:hypothetical protein
MYNIKYILIPLSSDPLSTSSVHVFLVPSIPAVSNFLVFIRYSSFQYIHAVNTTNGLNNKTTYDRCQEKYEPPVNA